MTTTTKRLPRPLGITTLMGEFHTSRDPKILEQARNQLIHLWLVNNGSIGGLKYSVGTLSLFLGVGEDFIRQQMGKEFLSSKLLDKDNQQEIMAALVSQQMIWNMEDRMAISEQEAILAKSQGGKFKPFITGEMNRVLGLKLTTTGNLMRLSQSINGGGTINIFNQQNNQNNTQVINNFINKEEAMRLVEENNAKMLEESKNAEVAFLEAHYDLNELPQIRATEQQGVTTEKEGIPTLNTQEIMRTIDAKYEDEYTHHRTRREKELQIDLDAEDPENVVYEEIPVMLQ